MILDSCWSGPSVLRDAVDPVVAHLLLDPGADCDVARGSVRDPFRAAETGALAEVQRRLARPPVVRAARGMSLLGEHAAGWLVCGLLGAVLDRRHGGAFRRGWLYATAGVAVAHGASIVVKRVVRRPRPADDAVEVLVGTPSKLSFPSAHATSTTAAAVLYGSLLGSRLPLAVVPPMLMSRLVLGVHFPSDVLAGSALGATVAGVTRRVIGRFASRAAARQEDRP
jgi:hypothetical protein